MHAPSIAQRTGRALAHSSNCASTSQGFELSHGCDFAASTAVQPRACAFAQRSPHRKEEECTCASDTSGIGLAHAELTSGPAGPTMAKGCKRWPSGDVGTHEPGQDELCTPRSTLETAGALSFGQADSPRSSAASLSASGTETDEVYDQQNGVFKWQNSFNHSSAEQQLSNQPSCARACTFARAKRSLGLENATGAFAAIKSSSSHFRQQHSPPPSKYNADDATLRERAPAATMQLSGRASARPNHAQASLRSRRLREQYSTMRCHGNATADARGGCIQPKQRSRARIPRTYRRTEPRIVNMRATSDGIVSRGGIKGVPQWKRPQQESQIQFQYHQHDVGSERMLSQEEALQSENRKRRNAPSVGFPTAELPSTHEASSNTVEQPAPGTYTPQYAFVEIKLHGGVPIFSAMSKRPRVQRPTHSPWEPLAISSVTQIAQQPQPGGALAFRSDLPFRFAAEPTDERDFLSVESHLALHGSESAALILPEQSQTSNWSARLVWNKRAEVHRYYNHLDAFLRGVKEAAHNKTPKFAAAQHKQSQRMTARNRTDRNSRMIGFQELDNAAAAATASRAPNVHMVSNDTSRKFGKKQNQSDMQMIDKRRFLDVKDALVKRRSDGITVPFDAQLPRERRGEGMHSLKERRRGPGLYDAFISDDIANSIDSSAPTFGAYTSWRATTESHIPAEDQRELRSHDEPQEQFVLFVDFTRQRKRHVNQLQGNETVDEYEALHVAEHREFDRDARGIVPYIDPSQYAHNALPAMLRVNRPTPAPGQYNQYGDAWQNKRAAQIMPPHAPEDSVRAFLRKLEGNRLNLRPHDGALRAKQRAALISAPAASSSSAEASVPMHEVGLLQSNKREPVGLVHFGLQVGRQHTEHGLGRYNNEPFYPAEHETMVLNLEHVVDFSKGSGHHSETYTRMSDLMEGQRLSLEATAASDYLAPRNHTLLTFDHMHGHEKQQQHADGQGASGDYYKSERHSAPLQFISEQIASFSRLSNREKTSRAPMETGDLDAGCYKEQRALEASTRVVHERNALIDLQSSRLETAPVQEKPLSESKLESRPGNKLRARLRQQQAPNIAKSSKRWQRRHEQHEPSWVLQSGSERGIGNNVDQTTIFDMQHSSKTALLEPLSREAREDSELQQAQHPARTGSHASVTK